MARLSRKVFTAILITLIGTNGCKDDYTSVIPYVYVNFAVNPTSYIELNIPGGSVYFANAGFGGIILFTDLGGTMNPFLVYDAACTYEASSTTRVVADGSGIATCPACHSQFILFGGNGSPVKGPATEPLKQYQATNSGGRILIRN